MAMATAARARWWLDGTPSFSDGDGGIGFGGGWRRPELSGGGHGQDKNVHMPDSLGLMAGDGSCD